MEPPLGKDIDVFRWGPIPCHLYYADDFTIGIFSELHKSYPGYPWTRFVALFKDGRGVYASDHAIFRKDAARVFLDLMLPEDKRASVKKHCDILHEKLYRVHRKIDGVKLPQLSDEEFIALWEEQSEAIRALWVPFALPEYGNYGSSDVLQERMTEFVPSEEIPNVMEILAAPVEMSFHQEEEISLAENDDLEEHQSKFFWLQNGYGGTKVLPVSFFEDRKRHLEAGVRDKISSQLKRTREAKEEARKRYGLPDEIMLIADRIADGIIWQDERKRDQLIDAHYKTIFLEDAARRLDLDQDILLRFTTPEIISIMKGELSTESRGKKFSLLLDRGVEELGPEETDELWNLYIDERSHDDIKELKGIVANRGNVTGKVRVLLDPYDVDSFKKGDILVAPMTSPEYVFAMRKASAIVTDTGGLTSHAAIVSRELGVPCVVGTRKASSVLKDGDIVEVDAIQGIVRLK